MLMIRCQAKLAQLKDLRSKRVRVFGWVHRLRPQKDIIFLVLRDGTGYLQAVLSGQVVSPDETHTRSPHPTLYATEPNIPGPYLDARIIHRACRNAPNRSRREGRTQRTRAYRGLLETRWNSSRC
jgi:hypothetical protein